MATAQGVACACWPNSLLPRRRRHRRRVMIYDHPVPALLDECEAVSRRQRPGFPVLDVRERVVASVDRGVAVDADQLIAKSDLEARQHFESGDEIIAQRCSI